jgi:single-strand DNA-binding protein
MSSLNSYNFTGHLGRDPELRAMPDGGMVCNMSVAVERYGDKSPVWVDVSVFGKSAEACAQYLAKGREVAINGRVADVRAFLKRDGEPGAALSVATSDVSFVGGRPEPDQPVTRYAPVPAPAGPGAVTSDDDIPF